jgi:hypothetical protein
MAACTKHVLFPLKNTKNSSMFYLCFVRNHDSENFIACVGEVGATHLGDQGLKLTDTLIFADCVVSILVFENKKRLSYGFTENTCLLPYNAISTNQITLMFGTKQITFQFRSYECICLFIFTKLFFSSIRRCDFSLRDVNGGVYDGELCSCPGFAPLLDDPQQCFNCLHSRLRHDNHS